MSNGKGFIGKRLKTKPVQMTIRITLLVVASFFLGWGIFIGEPFTILNKAIYICFECIGVG